MDENSEGLFVVVSPPLQGCLCCERWAARDLCMDDILLRYIHMNTFRFLLVAIFISIVAYTVPVVEQHGMGLLPVFFGDIAKMGWSGQFNLDFLCFLVLSATWVSWRHHFSPTGMVLGVVAFFGGAPFLSVYLLAESFRVNGNVAALLLGPNRAIGTDRA